MEWLTKEEIDEIVRTALQLVGDFNGSLTNYDFGNFDDFMLQTFKNSIDVQLNDRGFNIDLTIALLKTYRDLGKTLEEFAVYVETNQSEA